MDQCLSNINRKNHSNFESEKQIAADHKQAVLTAE